MVNKKIFAAIILVLALIAALYNLLKIKAEYTPKEEIIKEQYDESDEELVETEEEEFKQEASEEMEPKIAKGKEAPDFTLLNLDGEEVSLSDFRGKYVLINFWGTWCQWCEQEMPDLQKVYDENEDLVVLAVNVMEEKSDVEGYIKEHGYSFPVLLDADGNVALTYLVSGYPTSYFVDRDGILLGGVFSYMTYEQMNEILDGIRGESGS